MTMVLEADVAAQGPAIPAAADTLEELIASHRAALRDLAPRQAERGVREDTGWHIQELGLLLRVRDSQGPMQTQNPAPSGVHLPERGPARENTGTDRSTR